MSHRIRAALLIGGLAGLPCLPGCGLSLTVGGIVWTMQDDDDDEPNRAPTGSIETPAGLVNDLIALRYTVVDPEADAVSVRVRYSTDGGQTFAATLATPATGRPEHEGDANLATSATGTTHTFVWNTAVDLLVSGQLENVSNVVARIAVDQMDGLAGPVLQTAPFSVWNRYSATVAGGESAAFPGSVVQPSGMARDVAGHLFIADKAAHQVARLDAQTGALAVVAGTGTRGFNGDNVPATQAQLNEPADVAVDTAGNLFIADRGNNRIRRVDAATGFITTAAGNGATGWQAADEGATPVLVPLTSPEGIQVDGNGHLWIADTGSWRVRCVNTGAAAIAFTYWTNPGTQTVTIQPNTIRTVAGGWISLGEDISPLAAVVPTPKRVRLIEFNNALQGFAVAESTWPNRVRVVSLRTPVDGSTTIFYGATIANGAMRTVAGTGFFTGPAGTVGDNGPATSGKLSAPAGLDVFFDVVLTVADTGNNKIRIVTNGVISSMAGSGAFGFGGDGAYPVLAALSAPLDGKLDESLNLFVADTYNSRIRLTNTGLWSGVFAPAATDVWMVGGAGLAMRHDGTAFTPRPVGSAEFLLDAHGTGATDVLACGIKGGLYRWNGTQWTPESSGTTQPLIGLWCLSSSAQWAVGAFGQILFNNGSGWQPQSSGVPATIHLYDVWAASTTNAWAVGDAGTVRYWNGSNWAAESGLPAGTAKLNAVQGRSTTDLWVVGSGGTIWHKTGAGWADLTSSNPTTTDLNEVWPVSGSDVFFVGKSGAILRWNGLTFSTMTAPVTGDLEAVYGTSASNVYAVGGSDVVLRFDGSNWTQLVTNAALTYAGVSVPALTINSITQPPPRPVLAVIDPQAVVVEANGDLLFANSGTNRVMRLDAVTRAVTTVAGTGRAGFAGDGGAAAAASGLTAADLHGVWGASATDCWAVGNGGALLRYNGSAWSAQVSGVAADLRDVHGTGAGDVWVVGTGGVIRRWNGSAWAVIPSGTTADLNGVFALSSTDVIAVGAGGTLLRWNGTAWIDQRPSISTPPTTDLTNVWAAGATDAWVVGAGTANPTQSSLWRLTTGGWARFVPPTGTIVGFHDVFGTASASVTIVGESGLVLLWNGSGWASDGSVVGSTLRAVFGRSASDRYAAGDTGSFEARGATNWTNGTVTGDDIAESVGLRAGVAFGTAAYVVGDDGSIYQQSSAGNAWVLQHGLAQLSRPVGLALGANGQVCYVADADNQRVRAVNLGTTSVTLYSAGATRVIPAGGIVTVAGGGSVPLFPNGDGSAATAAELQLPQGLAVDPGTGDLYIADVGHHRVRKIDGSTAIIGNVAGTGVAGYNGDGIAATTARLNTPYGVAFDRTDATTWRLLIADTANHRIRQVDSSSANISTVAGTGTQGFDSDGQSPTSTRLNTPTGVLVVAPDYYISDAGNSRIRKVGGSPTLVTTAMGTGLGGYGGDPKPPVNAQVLIPFGLAADAAIDGLYVADSGNGRIRRVRP